MLETCGAVPTWEVEGRHQAGRGWGMVLPITGVPTKNEAQGGQATERQTVKEGIVSPRPQPHKGS